MKIPNPPTPDYRCNKCGLTVRHQEVEEFAKHGEFFVIGDEESGCWHPSLHEWRQFVIADEYPPWRKRIHRARNEAIFDLFAAHFKRTRGEW